MNTATITIEWKKGEFNKGGYSSVRSGDVFYSAQRNLYNTLDMGKKYEVSYETNEKGYHTIKSAKLIGEAQAQSSVGTTKYGATDDKTAERIFCCGALNAFIAAGKIEPSAESVRKATDALRVAWRQTFGSPAPATAKTTSTTAAPHAPVRDDIDDEIPF